jgi:type IV pilus assembly protein PilV
MQRLKQERGFSLLEVLISMLIIMFGALGIAGMQFFAITSTENARYQNVATMLGSSLAASMQSNVAYWGTPPESIEFNGTAIIGGPPAYPGSCQGAANICTAPQMAAYDLKKWTEQIAGLTTSLLPSGRATIACPPGITPAVCTITLSWSERNISLNNKTGTETNTANMAAGTSQTNTYQTLVSIL